MSASRRVFNFHPRWKGLPFTATTAAAKPAAAGPKRYTRMSAEREKAILEHPDLKCNTRLFAPKQHHVKKPVLDLINTKKPTNFKQGRRPSPSH